MEVRVLWKSTCVLPHIKTPSLLWFFVLTAMIFLELLMSFWNLFVKPVRRTRIPAYPHTRIPAYPHTRIRAYPHTRISAYPHTRIPAYPHTRISAYPHTRISAYPHIRISAYPHIRIPAYPHIRVPAFSTKPKADNALGLIFLIALLKDLYLSMYAFHLIEVISTWAKMTLTNNIACVPNAESVTKCPKRAYSNIDVFAHP